MSKPLYWSGDDPQHCAIAGCEITTEFIDGATRTGPWASMCPRCWQEYGYGKCGPGLGQKYQRQDDGRWLKIEG